MAFVDKTYVVGDELSAANLNAWIRDNFRALAAFGEVQLASNTSITTTSDATIALGSTVAVGGGITASSGGLRLPEAGTYLIEGGMTGQKTAAGDSRDLRLYVGGSWPDRSGPLAPLSQNATYATGQISRIVTVGAATQVNLGTTGTANFTAWGTYYTWLRARRVGL